MKKRLYLCGLFIFLMLQMTAQEQSDCAVENTVFREGERITYTLSYNWFFVWTDVGIVNFTVNDTSLFGREVYNLRGEGRTFSFYDWFFQVRDVYESWVDPVSLEPVYYKRDVDEDGYLIDITYKYDYENGKAYSSVKKTGKKHFLDTLDLPACTYDIISVIYHARNIDFDNYEIDEKIPMKILLDNELTDIYIRYKGKEEKRVRHIGKFRCIKFTGSLIAGSVFKGGEDLEVWVTDDKNRVPVWIESPIIVGTVKARLTGYDGLKFPLESKIK